MSELDTVFFIHVPKAAGTSFRLALEARFPGRVAWDYGPRARDTSEWVREHVYREPDRDALVRRLIEDRVAVFGGHVGQLDYGKLFSADRTIAFLRDPVSRLVSEWHHHRRTAGMMQPLEEFIERPEMRNKQSQLLGTVPLEDYAVIGLASHYAESLELVRRKLGWRVSSLAVNRNPDKRVGEGYEVSPEIESRIRRLNGQDVALYERARALFWQRLTGDLSPGAVPPHGWLDTYRDGTVVGWACRPGEETPVFVRVVVDGRDVTTVVADRPRDDLKAKGIHVTGNAGFRAEIGPVADGALVRCFALPDEVELSGSPCRVVSEAADARR